MTQQETLLQQSEGKNKLVDNVYVHTSTPLIPHTHTDKQYRKEARREDLTKAITKNP